MVDQLYLFCSRRNFSNLMECITLFQYLTSKGSRLLFLSFTITFFATQLNFVITHLQTTTNIHIISKACSDALQTAASCTVVLVFPDGVVEGA